MPEKVLNVSGNARTTGTANPIIIGGTGKSGSLADVSDGAEVAYYRRYKSSKPGFENCIGIWRVNVTSAGIGYIERTSVEKSSNPAGDGTFNPVVWGVGEQLIDISVTPRMLDSYLVTVQTGKPQNETAFLVGTGQSNSRGAYQASSGRMVINPNVFDWQATTADPTTYEMVVADPNRSFSGGPDVPVGMRGDGYGHITWAAADAIQKAKGCRVCMLNVAKDAQTYSEWLDGGDLSNALAEQIGPAMAAAGVTKVDAVLWMQGEGDKTLGIQPHVYGDALVTIRGVAEDQGWSTPNYTHWILNDIGDSWGEWPGVYHAVQKLKTHASFINNEGRPEDNHFYGDTLLDIGVDNAAAYLSGPDRLRQASTKQGGRIFTSGKTGDINPIVLLQKASGSALINVHVVNEAKTQHWSALIHYSCRNDSAASHTILNQIGVSGFVVTSGTLGDGYLIIGRAPAGGQRWYWTIDVTMATEMPVVGW
jgi:hypothetical protein